jgi:hypothetical protein
MEQTLTNTDWDRGIMYGKPEGLTWTDVVAVHALLWRSVQVQFVPAVAVCFAVSFLCAWDTRLLMVPFVKAPLGRPTLMGPIGNLVIW